MPDDGTPPNVTPETLAILAGRDASGSSLAPALWASSTWESEGLDDAHRRATAVRHGDFYSRYSNPTVRSFEQAMAELEQVLGQLERGDVALDESIALYERGAALKKRCEQKLKEAEEKVAAITLDGDGNPTGTKPVEGL